MMEVEEMGAAGPAQNGGMSMTTFDRFDDFFRYYVSQHSKPATRWVHFVATHVGTLVGLTGLARRKPLLVAVAPALVYGPAFASHYLIEKNSPVTLVGNPFWAVRGDFQMIAMMYMGRDEELSRIAEDELDQAQPDIVLPGEPARAEAEAPTGSI
jgi:hypothetical protein